MNFTDFTQLNVELLNVELHTFVISNTRNNFLVTLSQRIK